MQGNSTYITDPATPDQEPRKFAFDFSYWSHDGFTEQEDGYLSPAEPHYADQVVIYHETSNFHVLFPVRSFCGVVNGFSRWRDKHFILQE